LSILRERLAGFSIVSPPEGVRGRGDEMVKIDPLPVWKSSIGGGR